MLFAPLKVSAPPRKAQCPPKRLCTSQKAMKQSLSCIPETYPTLRPRDVTPAQICTPRRSFVLKAFVSLFLLSLIFEKRSLQGLYPVLQSGIIYEEHRRIVWRRLKLAVLTLLFMDKFVIYLTLNEEKFM